MFDPHANTDHLASLAQYSPATHKYCLQYMAAPYSHFPPGLKLQTSMAKNVHPTATSFKLTRLLYEWNSPAHRSTCLQWAVLHAHSLVLKHSAITYVPICGAPCLCKDLIFQGRSPHHGTSPKSRLHCSGQPHSPAQQLVSRGEVPSQFVLWDSTPVPTASMNSMGLSLPLPCTVLLPTKWSNDQNNQIRVFRNPCRVSTRSKDRGNKAEGACTFSYTKAFVLTVATSFFIPGIPFCCILASW